MEGKWENVSDLLQRGCLQACQSRTVQLALHRPWVDLQGTVMTVTHPAKFSKEVLAAMGEKLGGASGLLLDPFAGVGGVHDLQTPTLRTVGIEIEPEWAAAHPQTIVGDATKLPFDDSVFDMSCSSPCYANRMADSHEAKDKSRRITYRHSLGRPLTPGNSGGMQWGEPYRELHRAAWAEVYRVLKPGGRFLLNISNHIRGGQEVPVVEWHVQTLIGLNFYVDSIEVVHTRRLRYGANRSLRVNGERIITARKA